jgi:hypothetical protein
MTSERETPIMFVAFSMPYLMLKEFFRYLKNCRFGAKPSKRPKIVKNDPTLTPSGGQTIFSIAQKKMFSTLHSLFSPNSKGRQKIFDRGRSNWPQK